MTTQCMKLILGGSDEGAAPSSSELPFQFYSAGDTLRLKAPRTPGELGMVGELCWDVTEDGNARLHLCVTDAVLDEDGEVLTAAVWKTVALTL